MPARDPQACAVADLELALENVREAGQLALEHLNRDTRHWRKTDGTPVSEADHAVNRMLMHRLRSARPAYGWLSEESQARAVSSDQACWVVNPIDGTRSFLAREMQWAICVAVVEFGRPTVAVVHAPALQQTYAAARTAGATLNGAAIRVSGRELLEAAVVLASRASLLPGRWKVPLPPLDARPLASLALRICAVARGVADAALALTYKSDWDLAAADLILCEAGGKMSDLAGTLLRYQAPHWRQSGFIAATPALHAAMLAHGPITAN